MKYYFAIIFILSSLFVSAQLIKFDADTTVPKPLNGHLKMGHPGPAGKELLVNNFYLTIGGQPLIPVMGEFHFSRCDKNQWEDVILKMKANGINIVASYVIWILHEEIEGHFNWQNNNDIRAFAKLCQKHGLFFYPRIGPWSHAEIRNGGTPDWILTKKYIQNRSNDPVYQSYVKKWYQQIALQLNGLLYKDGGPIIGIQLENEYRRGKAGESHIKWLKKTAFEAGFDVPLYTVTGWGNASVPPDEVIPLWGGYPSEPWTTHTQNLGVNQNYFFDSPKNDMNIGNEDGKKDWLPGTDYSRYPYFTCELGIGNQISEHRRPVIGYMDGLAIATTKVGAGSNLPGYYVFAGGSTPTGIFTTMEENRDETSYYNEYPDISYDFQAAITESGELAASYFESKKLHYFLNSFGTELAQMIPILRHTGTKEKDLQCAFRTNGKSGFLFATNYLRNYQKPIQKNVQFEIGFENENIRFPSEAIDIKDSTIFIWPVNLEMGSLTLRYATAQPLYQFSKGDTANWFFFQNKDISPEFCFQNKAIAKINAPSIKLKHKQDCTILSDIPVGLDQNFSISTADNKIHRIFVLSNSEALHFWKFNDYSEPICVVSNGAVYLNSNELIITPVNENTYLTDISGCIPSGKQLKQIDNSGVFKRYSMPFNGYAVKTVKVNRKNQLDNALWLKTNTDNVSAKNELHNVCFLKEFNLGNPSPIKSATLYFYNQNHSKINVNGQWLNQEIPKNSLNELDLTGYLTPGDNSIMIVCPTTENEAAMAARLMVNYYNTDRFCITTDESWITTTQYLIPSKFHSIRNLNAPVVVEKPISINLQATNQYEILLPKLTDDGRTCYLKIDYIGNKAQLRSNNYLIADNFFNGQTWSVRLPFSKMNNNPTLTLEIMPFEPDSKIYFELESPVKYDVIEIKDLRLIETKKYSISLELF